MTAAWVVALMGTGCSPINTVAGRPTTASSPTPVMLPQLELSAGSVAEQDPIHVLKDGLYNILREPRVTAIEGYSSQVAADGTTSKSSTFALSRRTATWNLLAERELVWSPSHAKWVETDSTETLAPGPNGARGWPTVRSVADSGTSYYTFSYQDLGSRALPDGWESGFSEAEGLPQSAQAGKFSPGARGYVKTETTVDPFYVIHRVKNAHTTTRQLLPVYACGQPSPECTTPASSLVIADQQGGQFTNFGVRLELGGNGHATLRPVDTPDIPLANLTYHIVDTDGPTRITLQAANPLDADKFGETMGVDLDHFALVEYDGQVTIGFTALANTTATVFAGYNRIAINDILTQWTPTLPVVLR